MSRFNDIRRWAEERNIITGSSPKDQMAKLMEEIGELAGAVIRGRTSKAVDGIGDAVVVLTIVAEQLGVSLEYCIEMAYDEIKDRKGRMVDGTFIKEDDL